MSDDPQGREQRAKDLVDVSLFLSETELCETLVLYPFEEIVLEKLLHDSMFEGFVCGVLCMESMNIIRM